MSLTDVVAELTSALEHEGELYASMLGLAHREQHALVRGDVVTLTRITEEKESLLELLAALETERMTAVVAIATATGIDLPDATLSSLAAALPADAQRQLSAARIELHRHATELRDANARNAALLRVSRDVVDRWLHYLRSMLSSVVYDSAGRPDEVGRMSRLDRSA